MKLLAGVLLCSVMAAGGQVRAPRVGDSAQTSLDITGGVVRDGTMKALDKARVELIHLESKELAGLPPLEKEPAAPAVRREIEVGRDGRFTLINVRPGRYLLIAEREVIEKVMFVIYP